MSFMTHYLGSTLFGHFCTWYVKHFFSKETQNERRKMTCREIGNETAVKNNLAVSSVDFIDNRKLSLKIITQELNAKLAENSMLIMCECRNVNQSTKQYAHIHPLNQTAPGWYSAVPALKHCYSQLQRDVNQQSTQLKSTVTFLDGGKSDVWCAPFIRYA